MTRPVGRVGRAISNSDATKTNRSQSRQCVSEAQQCVNAWALKLKRLAQEIGKRPAVSHIRPVLTKLELALCSVPDLSSFQHDSHHHQHHQQEELQHHIANLQQQNEQLKREVDELTAKLQLNEKASDSASGGDSPKQQTLSSLRTELEATKYQLAKHRKYAKEVKRTKQNLIATIQSMEESHRVQVKSMREEFESQLAQVLQRVTDETDAVSKFKTSADCVHAELASRDRQISELKQKLSERDAEVQQLLSINHTLQNRVAKHVEQLDAAVQCYQQQQDLPAGSLWQKVASSSSHTHSSPPRPSSTSSSSSSSRAGAVECVDLQPPASFAGDGEPLALPDLSLGWLEATLCQHAAGDEPEMLQRLEDVRREMEGLSRQLVIHGSGDASGAPASSSDRIPEAINQGVAQLTV